MPIRAWIAAFVAGTATLVMWVVGILVVSVLIVALIGLLSFVPGPIVLAFAIGLIALTVLLSLAAPILKGIASLALVAVLVGLTLYFWPTNLFDSRTAGNKQPFVSKKYAKVADDDDARAPKEKVSYEKRERYSGIDKESYVAGYASEFRQDRRDYDDERPYRRFGIRERQIRASSRHTGHAYRGAYSTYGNEHKYRRMYRNCRRHIRY